MSGSFMDSNVKVSNMFSLAQNLGGNLSLQLTSPRLSSTSQKLCRQIGGGGLPLLNWLVVTFLRPCILEDEATFIMNSQVVLIYGLISFSFWLQEMINLVRQERVTFLTHVAHTVIPNSWSGTNFHSSFDHHESDSRTRCLEIKGSTRSSPSIAITKITRQAIQRIHTRLNRWFGGRIVKNCAEEVTKICVWSKQILQNLASRDARHPVWRIYVGYLHFNSCHVRSTVQRIYACMVHKLPVFQQMMFGKCGGRKDGQKAVYETINFDASNSPSDAKIRLRRIFSFIVIHSLSLVNCAGLAPVANIQPWQISHHRQIFSKLPMYQKYVILPTKINGQNLYQIKLPANAYCKFVLSSHQYLCFAPRRRMNLTRTEDVDFLVNSLSSKIALRSTFLTDSLLSKLTRYAACCWTSTN